MEGLNVVQKFAVGVLPILFAITVHEAAHGWMAMRLGDTTAKMLGRVSVNPLKHIDPFGTVILPLMTYLLANIPFGWAKPVPVNWRNLRSPKRDMALVAAAGPGANFCMALLWALGVKVAALLAPIAPWLAVPLIYMGVFGVLVNSLLMFLNLIPILPLDGGRILSALLPPRLAASFSRIEPYGLFIVLGLFFLGVMGKIISIPIFVFVSTLPASDLIFLYLQTL